jgi:hypothetical protein
MMIKFILSNNNCFNSDSDFDSDCWNSDECTTYSKEDQIVHEQSYIVQLLKEINTSPDDMELLYELKQTVNNRTSYDLTKFDSMYHQIIRMANLRISLLSLYFDELAKKMENEEKQRIAKLWFP